MKTTPVFFILCAVIFCTISFPQQLIKDLHTIGGHPDDNFSCMMSTRDDSKIAGATSYWEYQVMKLIFQVMTRIYFVSEPANVNHQALVGRQTLRLKLFSIQYRRYTKPDIPFCQLF